MELERELAVDPQTCVGSCDAWWRARAGPEVGFPRTQTWCLFREKNPTGDKHAPMTGSGAWLCRPRLVRALTTVEAAAARVIRPARLPWGTGGEPEQYAVPMMLGAR